MKKIHLTALRATIFALITSTSLHAQTNITLDGTSGTNLFTNNYAGGGVNGSIIFSLGFFADYLVVGGGGGGGGSGTDTTAWGGGGGGAGGLLQGNTQLSASNYSVTVGAGGAGGPRSGSASAQQGSNGSNSVFGSLTAIGGGGGGAYKIQGNSGGSGGGGGGRGTGNDLRTPGGAGTTNGSIVQGFAGGASRDDDSTSRVAGGGGGGAGAVGGTGGTNTSVAGNGGAGLTNAITGTATVYAGGGGGGAWDNFEGETAGTGGAGGGGSGSTSGNASNGTNGLGGGGGGVGTQGAGGSGGSGVVIVRYQGSSLGPIGGTVTSGTGSAAGSTLHTFTNTGSANFDMAGVNLTNRLGATISGNVSAQRIDFNGPGTLTLAGSNTSNVFGLYANTGTVRLTGQFDGEVHIANPTNSTAAVVVDGGAMSVTGGLDVGRRGNGTLTLESGTISSSLTYLGYSTIGGSGVTNGTGTATINGGTWSNRTQIYIGDSGAGTLNVNGGTVVGGRMFVGRQNGGNGVVNVTGGSLSVGTLAIYLGNSQGVVNVTGGTLTATGNNGISVGPGGLTNGGVLNISNAGTVVSQGGLVLSSTNSELNLGAGGTLRIGHRLLTANPAGLQVNGALEFAGDSVTFQGKLSIGSGGTNGSLSGNLYDPSGGSSVTFNRSDDLTYSGNLLGLAALIKEGAGTLTLSGSNNFRGDTLVNNGRLVLGSSSALRSGAVVKVNTNGTIEAAQRVVIGYLDVNGGTVVGSNNLVSALTLVNSGQVAGLADGVDFAAGILKRTAGTATVDGTNTFTGLIRVEDGLLQLTNGGSFAAASSLVVSNAATVDLNGVSQQFSTVSGAGSVSLGSGTLTVGGSEDSAFSGAISGTGGLVKSGGGVMTLSGTSTYNGATTVSGGELIVDGAADSSTVTVSSGAILSGSGSIGGLIVNSGGTINPGNSPGTQTVVGNAVWNAGGDYNWEIHDATGGAGTGWDLYTITGTLDLGALSLGSEFNINLWSLSQVSPDINGDAINFDPAQNYTWTIATAAGGITNYTGANQFLVNIAATNGTGGFSNLLDSGTFSVVQSGNNLNLVFTSGGEPIPEPGTWAAAVLLAGGGAYLRWRRRRK